ncbi:RNA-binding protein Musashi homolog 1 isoform X3 [Durio zibethinus]|uniref:RNA-binding protein Musashi homolog 1 isoform X3 n=1 Tax=Durio zibethinus TaxID=66656 RepID=A0A6P6BDP1_DURZI|nr:RNA-binding protein Musashi homolog 1 isoform X3 [Durio zibethinus]
MDRKLVVLGIPWEVDTEGLREYMSKYGDLEDCIVMKERSTGRSRGFGYVTFASADDAKNVLSTEHFLGERMLEVKIATPKEEMRAPVKKVTRIFVARIPLSVEESTFRSHFEEYDSVENLMADTHELGGSTVVVDRATPKEDDFKPIGRMSQGGYGAYNAYISAATRYAALGAPTLYDHPGPMYGRGESSRGMGKKIFVGRLPQEATADDLRQYFGRFGRIIDVYVPKDPKRSGHRGFGFVTFAEDGVADRVSRRSHEICGQQVAIDSATPVDDAGPSFMMNPTGPFRGFGGPMRPFGRMYGGLPFDDQWGYPIGSARPSRADWRYRPY